MLRGTLLQETSIWKIPCFWVKAGLPGLSRSVGLGFNHYLNNCRDWMFGSLLPLAYVVIHTSCNNWNTWSGTRLPNIVVNGHLNCLPTPSQGHPVRNAIALSSLEPCANVCKCYLRCHLQWRSVHTSTSQVITHGTYVLERDHWLIDRLKSSYQQGQFRIFSCCSATLSRHGCNDVTLPSAPGVRAAVHRAHCAAQGGWPTTGDQGTTAIGQGCDCLELLERKHMQTPQVGMVGTCWHRLKQRKHPNADASEFAD